MTKDEVADFELHPWHADAARLRRWDDAAKVAGLPTDTLDTYETLLSTRWSV